MEINKPDNLRDVAHLGLTLAEAKQLLAKLQQEIVAAQAKTPAVGRPDCPCGRGVCHVKDYREHAVATLFGPATVRPPDSVVPHVVPSRSASTGHRIADGPLNWSGFRLTSRPS
jgi:hypothetical protein